MPCQDGGPSPEEYYRVTKENDRKEAARRKAIKDKLDNLTRMLCDICTVIERHHPDSSIQQSAGSVSGLRIWWDAHKKIDEKRKAKEALAKADKERKEQATHDRAALRQAGIEKLTLAERKALGL